MYTFMCIEHACTHAHVQCSRIECCVSITVDSWRGGASHRVPATDSDGRSEAEGTCDSHGSH